MIMCWKARTVTSRLQLDNGLVIASLGPAKLTLLFIELYVNGHWAEVEKHNQKTGELYTSGTLWLNRLGTYVSSSDHVFGGQLFQSNMFPEVLS